VLLRFVVVPLLALVAGACSGPKFEVLPDAGALDVAATDLPPSDLFRPDVRRPLPDWPDNRPLKSVEGLRNDALKKALYDLVKDHKGMSYTKAKAAIFIPASGGLDVHGGMVECVYTGRTYAADGTTSPGGMNVEHSWPQSEGADTAPAEGDLHHLFPASADANSHRSSLSYGTTSCVASACSWQDGGSKIGPSNTTAGKVFEVRPARRGDIARAHFYFAVRYQMTIPAAEQQVLRDWNLLDLPDDLERSRNDAIEKLQNNRNPFIDRPDFVDYIAAF
jgi:hypothetical protein